MDIDAKKIIRRNFLTGLINLVWVLLSIIAINSQAAIDLTVDITGTDEKASTLSDKVFIERLELSFPNGRLSQSIRQNTKGFYATARFKYLGNGPLTIRWLVDGRVVSQSIEILSFGHEVKIRSDKNKTYLPTFQRGTHSVAIEFRNKSGLIALATRKILYYVTDGVEEFQPDSVLQTMYPKDREVDPSNFYFRWKGLANFQVYQIEVESLQSSNAKSGKIINALSKIDVYAPSIKQREALVAGNYRWRVKGLYKDKKTQPLLSNWAEFKVIESDKNQGGLFIHKLKTKQLNPIEFGNSRVFSNTQRNTPTAQRLNKSQLILGQGNISAGQSYQLEIDIQNSGLYDRDNLQIEVRDNDGLVGRFPVSVSTGKTASVVIPLDSAAVISTSFDNLSVRVTANNSVIDEATINLTIEPKLSLDDINFSEVIELATENYPIIDQFGCGRGVEPDRKSAISRIVSATNYSQPNAREQSLLEQGYFHFDQGEQVEFTLYFKDIGMGDWFEGSANACNTNVLLPAERLALENQQESLIQQIQTCRSNNIGGDITKACGPLISDLQSVVTTLAQADAALGNISIPLKLIAYPLNSAGQVSSNAIVIGSVAIDKDFDGLMTVSKWRIPATGQYKISLNDIGDPADLYATLPGGFPRYIHAAGFVLDVQEVYQGSSITSQTPRQAVVSGLASTSWLGDANSQSLFLNFNQISLNLTNPLHGNLSGGSIKLQRSDDLIVPQLRLYQHDYELLDLTLNLSGAQADLSYRLPEGYNRASSRPPIRTFKSASFLDTNIFATNLNSPNTIAQASSISGTTKQANQTLTISETSNSLSIAQAYPQLATNEGELIQFNKVDVLNGGEFIARFNFDNSWADKRLKADNLAIRLKGSTLVIDASPHLSYTDYTQQGSFTGVGIHDAFLRVRVNSANGLFSVSNPDSAFIYGKANWLSFGDNGLSGEDIEVTPTTAVGNFFGQIADDTFDLIQPYGFNLRIKGGLFSLQNSKVGGLDLSGSVSLPQLDDSSVTSIDSIQFNHLSRRQTADANLSPAFTTERIQLENHHFNLGAFDYKPDTARLNIGNSQVVAFPSPVQPGNLDQMEYRELEQWYELLYPTLNDQAGLLLSNGTLSKGWERIGNETSAQTNLTPRGAFLINQSGLQGQWAEISDSQHYRVNGFDTNLTGLWFQFKDSALIESSLSGLLNIPYPVQQNFSFNATVTQDADIHIAQNALKISKQAVIDGFIELPYWHARLSLPTQSLELSQTGLNSIGQNRTGQNKGSNFQNGSINNSAPINNVSRLIFDAENQRIKILDMGLSLVVEDSLGGDEFVTGNKTPPFTIDTFILPSGQLAETSVSPSEELYFIGQTFEPDSQSAISFLPYLGDHQPPAGDVANTAQPLIEITGEVSFSVFGPQQVIIQHTAVGARVPEIKRAPGVDLFWGDGVIRVNADLKFANSFGINPDRLTNLVAATTGEASRNTEAFKAFVGKADLVVIDAVSIKGLAEAGLHFEQKLDDEGNWLPPNNQKVAYERIGLGAGADLLKATLAGVRGMETATKLGGAVISGVTGVEGMGQDLVDLGVDAISFVESVAMATGIGIASGGTAAAEEIRHAIDNGFATTASGIKLLRSICQQDENCQPNTSMQLDIASLLARSAGAITHFDNPDPKELASLGLQTMDIGIPILQGVDLDLAISGAGLPTTLNDKKGAALSTAHVVVGAARTILDRNGRINFDDFINISRLSVRAARDMTQISEVRSGINGTTEAFIDMSVGLAEASIDLVQDLSDGDKLTQLGDITNRYMTLLCSQADNLAPLFRKAGLPAESDHLIKAVMSNSQAVLNKVSIEGLPSSPDAVVSQFLVTLLETLGKGAPNIPGCSVPAGAEAPMVQAMLKTAAHSLKPMTGSLTDEGKQIAWALKGISLSLDATESMAAQMNIAVPIETSQIKQVLFRLQNTFETLNNDLDSSDQTAKAQTVLRLAKGIPAAFDDILEGASSQASELMGIYIVLMTELEKLLPQASAIAGNNFDAVDFYSLPLALINEAQDLTLLNQCQKYGLANMAHVLSLGRELSTSTPTFATFFDKSKIIHDNIKQCDPTGISNTAEVEQLMAMLELVGSAADNNQQTLALVKNAMPKLIPLFVGKSAEMIDATQALVSALPIVDFTRDDLETTLDATLNRLLAEAELKTSDSSVIRSIRQARSIVNHANLNLVGLTLTEDDAGNVTKIKHLRADGSYRIVDVSKGSAHTFYPELHPDYAGGSEEKWTFEPFAYNTLANENKQSLFTDGWNELIEAGELKSRKYKDDDKNKIVIVEITGGVIFGKITSAISYNGFTPITEMTLLSIPDRGASSSNVNDIMDSITTIQDYREYGEGNTSCVFTGGCAYYYTDGTGTMLVRSIANPSHEIDYLAGVNPDKIFQSLDDVDSESIVNFEGYIVDSNSVARGWNPDWRVKFSNHNHSYLTQNQSTESYFFDGIDAPDSLEEIALIFLQDTEGFATRTVVNGSDIWHYDLSTGGLAKHTFGDGEWALYNMPETPPAGTDYPAPNQPLIDVVLLELVANGNRNGVSENPGGLVQSTNEQGDAVFTVPAEQAEDVITIGLSGSNAGAVMVGDVDIATASQSGVVVSEVASTEQQDNGNLLVELNDGSTVLTQGSNSDNLKVTRTTYVETRTNEQGQSNPVNHRRVQIQYCNNANVSWANCTLEEKFDQVFDYLWLTDYSSDQSYVDHDLNSRPVITPASGINASVKHQKWLEIFALEQTLLQQPTESGLQQLNQLFTEAQALGLPIDEVNEQNGYISARIINLLIIKHFNEVDTAADDLSKYQYWKENPTASPVGKIKALVDQLAPFEFATNSNFSTRYLEVLNLNYRLLLHDLNDFQIGDSNLQITAGLSQKISSLFDIIVEMKRFGDDPLVSTDYYFACNTIQQVRDYTTTNIYDNPNYVPLDSDFKMILEVEGAHQDLGCSGESNLAEFSDLYSNSIQSDNWDASIKVVRLRRLGQSILRQDQALDDFNGDGSLNAEDIIHFYLGSIMGLSQLSDLQAPAVEDYQDWMQHILNLDRLIKEIDGESDRRGGNAYFYSTNIITFKNTLTALLIHSWEGVYSANYNQFLNIAETMSLEDLKTLAKHYDTHASINSQLVSVDADSVIKIETGEYLKVEVASDWISPLQQMKANQTEWLDGIWLQSVVDNPTMQVTVQKLIEQDRLIKYLMDNLSIDQLAGIQRFETRVSNKMNLQMDAVENALAAEQGTGENINLLVEPITAIDQFLTFLQLNDAQQLFQTRTQQLLDQSINRVKDDSSRVQSELKKIIAINTAQSGNNMAVLAGLENNTAFRTAIHEVGTNAIFAVNSGGGAEEIRNFLEIVAIEQRLEFSDPEWAISDVYVRVRELIQQAKNDLLSSNDLAKIKVYLDLMAQAQLLGIDDNIDFDPAVTVLESHINDLAACEALQNCTINHIRSYMELYAAISAMGYGGLEIGLAQVGSMMTSSPETMVQSIRFDSALPDLKQIVLSDKAGDAGRLAAAESLEQIGTRLPITNTAGRMAMGNIISRLQSLAALSLPSGSVKPNPADDPLLQSANNLQQIIDSWVETVTEQLVILQSGNNSQVVDGGIINLADTLGISEEELNGVILPEINGDVTDTRVVRGNKYRLAADALDEIANRDAEVWRELSYQLMRHLPDPEVTAEGDYRLSAITQLTGFVLKSAGLLTTQAATDSFDADSLKQIPAGDVILTLLSLPVEQNPIQNLAGLIETQLLSPLVTGDNATLQCSEGVLPCVLGASLQFVGIGLDSLIAGAQQTTAESSDTTNSNLARFMVEQLAERLSGLSDGDDPDNFWIGLAGEGLSISLNAVEQGTNLETEVVIGGLVVAQKLLDYQPVKNLVQDMPQPVPMAFFFVRDSSQFLSDSLAANTDQNLPVAIARLTNSALTDSIRSLDQKLADFSNTLMTWQLDFADKHWGLVESATQGTVNAQSWLDALTQSDGVATLSCQINKLNLLGDVQLPTALVMTPFVSASSLLNNQNLLGNTAASPAVLADLAADLSNVWFTPLSENCDDIAIPTEDQALAKLIRPLKTIDPSKKPDLIALQLVGDLAIGAMDTLLPPNTSFSEVMNLLWSGQSAGSNSSPGISDFLRVAMAGESQNLSTLYLQIERVPLTLTSIVEVMVENPNDPTAKALRLLTGNTIQNDLLPPDRLLGSADSYKIPNALLAVLGDVRKAYTPTTVIDYVNDDEWGYLKTMPFIEFDINTKALKIIDLDSYQAALTDILSMAVNLDPQGAVGGVSDTASAGFSDVRDTLQVAKSELKGVLGATASVVKKVVVTAADIARMGVNGIGVLLNPDIGGHQTVAAIGQQAIFSDLAGETEGFSGVSGGLQREWPIGSDEFGDLTLEMYGQLVFPFMGGQVGLMQLVTGENNHLHFKAALQTDGVGDFVGGLTGEMSANLSLGSDGSLRLEYEGEMDLSILSNTIGRGSVSGLINDFEVPNAQNFNLQEYIARQARDIDILQCMSLTGQVLPFPLSLSGVGATATVAGFAEKENLGLMFGARVGLSGNLNVPILTSLLGVELGGTLTSGYITQLVPGEQGGTALSSCLNPEITLTVLGQRIPITALSAQTEAFVEVDLSGDRTLATGIKIQAGLDSSVMQAFSEQLGCSGYSAQAVGEFFSDLEEAVVNTAAATVMCPFINMSQPSLWVVLRNVSITQNEIMIGLGDLPTGTPASEPFIKIGVTVNPTSDSILLRDIGVTDQVGGWGGWSGSSNIGLCNANLCELEQ